MFEVFSKKLSEITLEDVQNLVDKKISEGWFIEYKSQIPDSKALAKSISSFANQEGGWVFIGVLSDNQTNTAKEICGFTMPENNIDDWIRNSIVGNISPCPFFESLFVTNEAGVNVAIIRVEKGFNTPYVHSEGKIFVRNGAGAMPIKDRGSLFELNERKDQRVKLIENLSSQTYGRSKKQENWPYIEYYFFPENFMHFKIKDFHEKTNFEKIKSCFSQNACVPGAESCTAQIDFNCIYTSSDSIILNTVSKNVEERTNLGITLEIMSNGFMKAHVPLSTLKIGDRNGFEIHEGVEEFFYTYFGVNDCRIINLLDGMNLFILNLVVVERYIEYLKLVGINPNRVSTRFKCHNIWKSILYFDGEYYKTLLLDNGFPLNHKEEVEFPIFLSGRCLELDTFNSLQLFLLIVESLGISSHDLPNLLLSITDYWNKHPNITLTTLADKN